MLLVVVLSVHQGRVRSFMGLAGATFRHGRTDTAEAAGAAETSEAPRPPEGDLPAKTEEAKHSLLDDTKSFLKGLFGRR